MRSVHQARTRVAILPRQLLSKLVRKFKNDYFHEVHTFMKMMISLEYIWIGGKNTYTDLRSKMRRLNLPRIDPSLSYVQLNEQYLTKIPEWNFDGSSTGQADSKSDTEIVLYPVAVCKDPFREESLFVLCECFLPNGAPHESNTRHRAAILFQKYDDEHPWFGLEQEYVLTDPETNRPVGWPRFTEPEAQGKYYCGNGNGTIFRRDFLDAHFQACCKADLDISGYNAEVMPGQYEFQIGPTEGISAADQLIFARFVLLRIAERARLELSYSPKPIKGDWNGSGLHHNFSTQRMREENGYEEIENAVQKLGQRHAAHLKVYGEDNHLRLTGTHESSSFKEFSVGVGTRNTSVRIPNTTAAARKGYFEDRRPAANCDPYQTTASLMATIKN